jgi:hypothetical protein
MRRKQRQWYFRKEGQQSKAEFMAQLNERLTTQLVRQDEELARLVGKLTDEGES